jgi:methylated-DNA-[protein]-cysteine S-methyltransferase
MSILKGWFKEKVFKIVRRIPKGKTLTYQEVAKLAGSPRAYRAVGNILNKNRDFKNVPCHRVVRSNGDIGGYVLGTKRKLRLLRKEGVLK